jgi:hypothetical protein
MNKRQHSYNALIGGFQIDFAHLDRMQRRIMAKESWITENEFRSEPAEEQYSYYRWMLVQCGELADLI